MAPITVAFRFNPDAPSVASYDCAAQSQSQTGARNLAAMQPLQWLKNTILMVRRNSLAVILHGKLPRISGSAA